MLYCPESDEKINETVMFVRRVTQVRLELDIKIEFLEDVSPLSGNLSSVLSLAPQEITCESFGLIICTS